MANDSGQIDKTKTAIKNADQSQSILAVQTLVLQKIAMGLSLPETFEAIIHWIETAIEGTAASVLLLTDDGATLRTACAPNLPVFYNEAIDALPVGPVIASRHNAAFGQSPIIVWDILEDPIWQSFKDFALKAGLQACWAYPILSSDGKILGTFAVYFNHPNLPEAGETELISAASYLAAIAIERQTSQENLIKAKEQAVAANNAKSRFLANMSHEIRTPMNCILGMSDLALETVKDKDQKVYMELIRDAASNLLNIVNQVLDFSKIESGKMEIAHELFDLRKLVDNCMEIFKIKFEEKKIVFVSHIESNLPRFLIGDEIRLKQLINNLISNAIKFVNPNGAVILCIGIESYSGNNLRMHVSISDTGVGIPLNKQNLVFDSFTQADSATTRKYGGTGLGLTICKQLVELMGGEIWIKSCLKSGSTFHFIIPLEVPCSQKIAESSAATAGQNNELKRPVSILLAEDNPINAKLATKLLQKRGFQVTVVANGRAVLESLTQKDFDLILMDCQMPELDGFQTTKAIRRAEEDNARHVPIIAVTAGASEDDRQRCIKAGMDQFLSKPYKKEDLWRIIDELLK